MYAVSNKDENVHRFTVRGGTTFEREREILRERMKERERERETYD